MSFTSISCPYLLLSKAHLHNKITDTKSLSIPFSKTNAMRWMKALGKKDFLLNNLMFE